MIRKTINNEGEWVKAQEELFAKGYGWLLGGKELIKFPSYRALPFDIIIKDGANMMHGECLPSPRADIAETVSNEAVYLEALEQIAEVVRIVARGVNVTADDMKKLADYADGFVQIKNIVFTALDVVNTGTGEVDRTQEYEEDKLSNRMV